MGSGPVGPDPMQTRVCLALWDHGRHPSPMLGERRLVGRAGLTVIAVAALVLVVASAASAAGPSEELPPKPVEAGAGGYHSCVLLEDGDVGCWGDNAQGSADDYRGGDAEGLAAGFRATCVVLADGDVRCWGGNNYGETENYHGGDATQVDTSGFHTCMVLDDGDVRCQGYNVNGQADNYRGGDAVEVTTGWYHTCALLERGNVHCWGTNGDGQSEDYVGRDAVEVSAGRYHSCARLSVGDVRCWGDGYFGQDRDYTNGDAVDMDAGNVHNCVAQTSGDVHCWGDDGKGKSQDLTGADAVGVSAGYDHSCARTAWGNVHCWGDNSDGRAEDYDLPPSTPRDPTATAGPGERDITIAWEPPRHDGGAGVQAYHVYHATQPGGPYERLVTVSGFTTSYTHTDLEPGSHWYVVSAANQEGESLGTEDVTVPPPSPPRDLDAEPGPWDREVTLDWRAPTQIHGADLLAYHLYRASEENGAYEQVASLDADETTYTDEDLRPGTYHYQVTAVTVAGESDPSGSSSATAPILVAEVQRGTLEAEGAGAPRQVDIVVPRANEQPGHGTLAHELGPVSTSYDADEDPVCVQDVCRVVVGVDPATGDVSVGTGGGG